ncbi:MAG: oxidoreductase [Flavobacteriaceae bacterium]|nr:MAG: oxidoreductase [Flavobacteriaceae bacterium]
MDLQLKNKTAFISGSTAGIGFATARALLKEGARVVINGRTEEGINLAIDKLKEDFPNADILGLPADFGILKEVESLLQQLPKIDILINNVGVYKSASFFESSDEDWYRQFEINVMSGVRLSKYCLPKMLDANWGRVLFISSECATLVPTDMIAYSMTKAAILAISRGLAQMTKGTRVTINTILPGSTLSEGAEQFLEQAAIKEEKTKEQVETEFFSDVRTTSLLQRFAKVEEVAQTIAYFASPLSSATNGTVIKVDGGSTGGIL